MAGGIGSAKIYAHDKNGKQIYLHAMWKVPRGGVGRLTVHYVGCGRPGRSQQVSERQKNPLHREWLDQHWVPRTVLFAQPRRLENLQWLESVLLEYGCPEGLVIFETPFLANAELIERRLIEIYRQREMARFNEASGKLPSKLFKPLPNYGKLRPHVPAIRTRAAAGEGASALAREFGVDPASIRCVISCRTYKDVA